MTYVQAKHPGQRLVVSKHRVEKDRQMDGADCITITANCGRQSVQSTVFIYTDQLTMKQNLQTTTTTTTVLQPFVQDYPGESVPEG